MRRLAWRLLLLLAFTVPWEYSLNLGEPFGHVARIAGILALLAAIPAVLQTGSVRTPGAVQWLVFAFFLWLCASYLWTIVPDTTLEKIRGFFQELMIVWLIWEFADRPRDLRALMRAYVAGAWVLALLTLGTFVLVGADAQQIRFVAEGQDANDMARYLDMGLPMAALLLTCERGVAARLLAAGYLPLGFLAVLVTASREGFVAALIVLAGCGILLVRGRRRAALATGALLPVVLIPALLLVPNGTFERLRTIPEELNSGDLNQRWNIWDAGWQAFGRAPLLGTGAGSFVSASALSPVDTAHDTALSVLADGGLPALLLAVAIVALSVRAVVRTRGALRLSLGAALLGWMTTSLVATVEENRSTWLLIGLIALAERMTAEDGPAMDRCFGAGERLRDETGYRRAAEGAALLVAPAQGDLPCP